MGVDRNDVRRLLGWALVASVATLIVLLVVSAIVVVKLQDLDRLDAEQQINRSYTIKLYTTMLEAGLRPPPPPAEGDSKQESSE